MSPFCGLGTLYESNYKQYQPSDVTARPATEHATISEIGIRSSSVFVTKEESRLSSKVTLRTTWNIGFGYVGNFTRAKLRDEKECKCVR